MDDIVGRIWCLPGDLPASGFPDGEVFATGHDGSDFVLSNPIASASGQLPNTNIIPNILEVKVLKAVNIAEKFYNARESFISLFIRK